MLVHHGVEDGESPGEDMVADRMQHDDPMVGHIDAGIHRVEVEKADAEA